MKSAPEQITSSISELVKYEAQLFESLNKLKQLELENKTNTEEYEKETEQSLLYSTREKSVLDSIDCTPYQFEKSFKSIISNLTNFVPQYFKDEQTIEVKQRLLRVLGSKCKKLADKYKDFECEENIETMDLDTEFYGNDDLFEAIHNQIEMQRLIKIQEFIDKVDDLEEKAALIEEKFNLLYENKEIHDQLLQSSMNPYFLFIISDDILIQTLKVDKQKFEKQKEEQIINSIDDMIELSDIDKIEDINDIEQIVKQDCDLSFGYFLLNSLSTTQISKYLTEYKKDYQKYRKPTHKLMINMMNNILKKECCAVSTELLDQFISLIKLSEIIAEKHKILCELEKQNLKHSPEFEKIKQELTYYLELETDLLDNFEFNIQESDTLTDILDNHLPLLLKNEKNVTAVRKRIGNMIPDLIDDFSAVAYDEDISYIIHQNFITKTLKRLDQIIQEEEDLTVKNKLIEEKYLQCSYYRCINNDMIETDFQPNKLSILDDNSIADLLRIHNFEYGYDKNAELYVIGNVILHEIISADKKHQSIGYILYKKICLEEILKGINYENILDLEYQYDTQIKEARQPQMVEAKFKVKTLFQNAKPKYLK